MVVDNEVLIKKLVELRQLMLTLNNALPREVGLDEKHLDEVVGLAWEPSIFTKLFCCKKNIDALVQNINDLQAEVNVLGQQNYDVSGVFITLNREEDQQRILEAMQTRLVFGPRKEQNLLFRETALNVKQPGEPSSVRWHELKEERLVSDGH